MTLLEGPQKVDKCGENDEIGESDKSDEISLSLLTKIYAVNRNHLARRASKSSRIWRKLQIKINFVRAVESKYIDIIWPEGPQKVAKRGGTTNFGKVTNMTKFR